MTDSGLTYEGSGVSVDAQDRAIDGFRERVERSHSAALTGGAGQVLAGVGSFGAAFAPDISGMKRPVLISSTDGIGTKVRLHARFGTHAWAGADLVAAVTNDVLCQGARPLFFLDYLACHKVDPATIELVVGGMAQLCSEIGCALVGGEIAEMGDTYQPSEYDLAGFAVGVVDEDRMWGEHLVQEGDALVGIASSGVHCNGFSLVRRVFESLTEAEWRTVRPELGSSLHDCLLRPTACYAQALTAIRSRLQWDAVHAAAHISGGGLPGNLPRSIPPGLSALVDKRAVKQLAGSVAYTFDIIEKEGGIAEDEMWRVFNMGVGFVLVLAADCESAMIQQLHADGHRARQIGKVITDAGQPLVWSN
ncbi:MAG: phosphoribosylformylglycinamidine cyclo-ligase [bacterium]|nr:phosphoribosylformylglycinamidine cyclo-ligase [bacterium]